MFVRAMQSASHPILAQIVPIRRCNLDCAYCNEYDKTSAPVPLETMLAADRSPGRSRHHHHHAERRRADAASRISMRIIRRIRERGAIATLITNGLLLTPDRIRALNRAGLDYLQISIDNVVPDDVSKKSLRYWTGSFEWLARYAEFGVTINSVLGGGHSRIRRTRSRWDSARGELGFTSTVGILHDHDGQLKPLAAGPAECLRSFPAPQDGTVLVRAFRSFSGEHRAGIAERLALPRRRPIPVYLRGRAGALLLATARPARHSARAVHGRTTSAGKRRLPRAARRSAPFRAFIKPPCWTNFASGREKR